jgi:hypothetical protein
MKQTLLGAGAALCLLSFGSPVVAAGADDLVAAAKKEGALTVIALPRDWCGYAALRSVPLCGAGLLTFPQGLGLVFGANVATTSMITIQVY